MLRFLHAGDLHLGSAAAAFSPRAAARRRERQLAALERLLKDAVAAGAQLFLFAGDVFDTPAPDADLTARFFSILGAAPVPSLVVPGNHDFYRAGGPWTSNAIPENVYVFDTPTLSCIDFPTLNTSVWGYAFTGESSPSPTLGGSADRIEGRISLLLAHADLTSPISPYAPITAGQLEASGFAYAALGHIHNPGEPRRYGGTVAAYSGFFAGRGFDETGKGGALLVEIEGSHTAITPLESTADRFERRTLDLTGATGGEEVRTRVAAYLADCELSDDTALRLSLTGNVGLSCSPDTVALSALGERFALFEVIDETLPIFDAAYLEKDPTMRGAFYRAMLPRLGSADAETRATAAEALRLGFAALSGKEV